MMKGVMTFFFFSFFLQGPYINVGSFLGGNDGGKKDGGGGG